MYIPSQGADQEFQRVSEAMAQPQPFFLMVTSYSAPAKLIDGMVVLADGVHWNPGSGDGLYRYKNGTWKYLG